MKKTFSTILATALVIISTAAFGAVKDGQFSLSPVIGGYTYDGKQHLDTSLVYGARGGYNFTKHFGVEALFDYVNTEPTRTEGDVEMYRYGGEMLYHFMPDNTLVPYVAAGFSGVNFDGAGISNKVRGAFDYGAGIKYFLTDSFALRGDLRHIIYKSNNTTYNNLEYTLGAYIPFGGAAPAVKEVEPPPAPAALPVVAPPPAPADSDQDGVIDPLDKCPGTPAGVAVDQDGCPLDTDKDGVYDYLDKCPGTPVGIAVDANGCPLDSDKDGVFDYLDKCPGTPAGVAVDQVGCPLDSDKDGVYDYLDKCPETPAGTKVDKDGCPIVVESAKRFCDKPAVLTVLFDTNKADIKTKFTDDLNKLGEFLKEFPNAKGEISGHTDNVGGNKFNLNLSQRRADSVKKYLEKTFAIAPERVTAKGYGESKPIASNKTKEGRQLNRRIETNFICQ